MAMLRKLMAVRESGLSRLGHRELGQELRHTAVIPSRPLPLAFDCSIRPLPAHEIKRPPQGEPELGAVPHACYLLGNAYRLLRDTHIGSTTKLI